MEIEVQIRHKHDMQKYADYDKATFTEEDLLEFAKKYINDLYAEEREVLEVDIMAIKP